LRVFVVDFLEVVFHVLVPLLLEGLLHLQVVEMQLFLIGVVIFALDRVRGHPLVDRPQLVLPVCILRELALVHLSPHARIGFLVVVIVNFFLVELSDLLARSRLLHIRIVLVYEADPVPLVRREVVVRTPLQRVHVFCDALALLLVLNFLVVALLRMVFDLVFVE